MPFIDKYIRKRREVLKIVPAGSREAILTIGDYALLTCSRGIPTLYLYTAPRMMYEVAREEVRVSKNATPITFVSNLDKNHRYYRTVDNLTALILNLAFNGDAVIFQVLKRKSELALGICVTRFDKDGIPFWKIPTRKFAFTSNNDLIVSLLEKLKVIVTQ